MATHTGSRVIKAPPHAIYRAFLEPSAVASWRPPRGMSAKVYAFEPRAGGGYRMAFVYDDGGRSNRGKTSADADVFEARFAELVPDARIVEVVRFQSDDPAFAGEMTLTTTLHPLPAGTEVTVLAENVPRGISAADHSAGIASSLESLARYVE
ncbi:SRPBCC family protein [Phenylobacterium sp.]|uniref:SRPBCC family protein n=1 Tax=Phenylobacterium sp. TaxID=1871053 RepID=UPI002EDA6A34